jgi:Uma2 family endonuclease
MAAPALKPATYEDVLNAPEHLVAELIHGVLYTHPRPRTAHARSATVLGGELHGPFDRGRGGPGGWLLLDEPELHLGGNVLVPDLGGWRRERLPEMPLAPAISVAPDWVCEVLSPSTVAVDRSVKLPVYAAHGVTHVWLVDSDAKTLEVLRLDGRTYRLMGTFANDAEVRAEPFEVFTLALRELWSR